jgi:Family of unknown function (DUF6580)
VLHDAEGKMMRKISLPNIRRTSPNLGADLTMVAGLIVLDVLARLMPHEPNVSPVIASALFAGSILRTRSLALAVPLLAMLVGDLFIGADDWRMTCVIYAALIVPAALAIWGRRFGSPVALLPLAVLSSVVFFVATNFAVWAFSGLYPLTVQGLTACYVAAIPFFERALLGDLFWTAVLFGGALLVQYRPGMFSRRA